MAERQAESTRVSRFSRNGKRNADSFADQPSKVPKFDSKVFRNLEGLEETWKESLPGDITMIIVKVFAAKQGENVIRDWKPTTSEKKNRSEKEECIGQGDRAHDDQAQDNLVQASVDAAASANHDSSIEVLTDIRKSIVTLVSDVEKMGNLVEKVVKKSIKQSTDKEEEGREEKPVKQSADEQEEGLEEPMDTT